jgi:hypothetical protein
MYLVRQQGKTLEAFTIFVDAWLFVYLELDAFARIVGPDGVWVVNPGRHTVN